jgi:hypothetical protein
VIVPTLQSQSITSVAESLDDSAAFTDGKAFTILLAATSEAFDCATWIDGKLRDEIVGVCEAAIALVMGRARAQQEAFGSDMASDKMEAYTEFLSAFAETSAIAAVPDMPPPPTTLNRQSTSSSEIDFDSFMDELSSLQPYLNGDNDLASSCENLDDLRLAVVLCDSMLTTARVLDTRVRSVEGVAGMSKTRSLRQSVKTMANAGRDFARIIRRAIQVHLVKLINELSADSLSSSKIPCIEDAKDWIERASEVAMSINPGLDKYLWWGSDYLIEKLVFRAFKRFAVEQSVVLDKSCAGFLAVALEDLQEALDLTETDGLQDAVAFLNIVGNDEGSGIVAREQISKEKGKGLNVVVDADIKHMFALFGIRK